MTKYEFSLRQEVLLEEGAGILGDLLRYITDNNITSKTDSMNVLYKLIRSAKRDIITSQTESELDQIEGKFCLARNFLSSLEPSKTKEIA